jgi:hypothetical protein
VKVRLETPAAEEGGEEDDICGAAWTSLFAEDVPGFKHEISSSSDEDSADSDGGG